MESIAMSVCFRLGSSRREDSRVELRNLVTDFGNLWGQEEQIRAKLETTGLESDSVSGIWDSHRIASSWTFGLVSILSRESSNAFAHQTRMCLYSPGRIHWVFMYQC